MKRQPSRSWASGRRSQICCAGRMGTSGRRLTAKGVRWWRAVFAAGGGATGVGGFSRCRSGFDEGREGVTPDLEWKRRYLLCRTLAESGHADEAARESEGMITAAENALQNPNRLTLISDSVVFRADFVGATGTQG